MTYGVPSLVQSLYWKNNTIYNYNVFTVVFLLGLPRDVIVVRHNLDGYIYLIKI